MMLLALAGTLIGAMLGIRCSVLALIPAMTGALIIAGAGAAAGAGAFGPTIVELALFLTCLQVGYLCGAALRFSIRASRAGRMERPAPQRPLSSVHSR